MKIIPTLLMFTILLTGQIALADPVWKYVSAGIPAKDFNCVAVDESNNDIILAGTSNGAYITKDGGENWGRIFTAWGSKKNVRSIYIAEKEILLGTDKGLYRSFDEGKNWQPSHGLAGNSTIFSLSVKDDHGDGRTILIVNNKGLYSSVGNEKEWKALKAFRAKPEIDLERGALPRIRSVAMSIASTSRLYLGTRDGIYVSNDSGRTYSRLTDEGLADKSVSFVAVSGNETDKLFIVTGDGIFYFDEGWHEYELPNYLGKPSSFTSNKSTNSPEVLLTDRGIYKLTDSTGDLEKVSIEVDSIFNYFNAEPKIGEVQNKAIRYAEVHPYKIANWRARANLSAIMPRLSFGIDKNSSDGLHWDAGQNPDTWVVGPENESTGWDITFTWNLGELVWNNDQTLIDVRSKLMVQLRDDILDEVNSYYFERRKLQIELIETPPGDTRGRIKKELRIQELTANLDALTGGYYSRRLESL